MNPPICSELTKNFSVRFNRRRVVLTEVMRAKVDRYWQQLTRGGKQYTRGVVFAMAEKRETKRSIEVVVKETDYAHYLYDQCMGKPGHHGVRVIHTAALVVARDQHIIFGEMGNHTAQAGMLQLCGGGIDCDDLRGDRVDLDHNIAKELQEEFGIDTTDPAQVARCERAFLKEGGPNGKLTVIYRVTLADTAAAFLARYQSFVNTLVKRGETPEFTNIIVLAQNENAIVQFFKANEEQCDEYMKPLFDVLLKSIKQPVYPRTLTGKQKIVPR